MPAIEEIFAFADESTDFKYKFKPQMDYSWILRNGIIERPVPEEKIIKRPSLKMLASLGIEIPKSGAFEVLFGDSVFYYSELAVQVYNAFKDDKSNQTQVTNDINQATWTIFEDETEPQF